MDAGLHCSQQAAHITIMPVLVFIHAQAAQVNLVHFLAVQLCFILHRFYVPPPSVSRVPLSCEKWLGTAGAQPKIHHWKEMKLVFVRQIRVPAVKEAHSWSGIHLP